MAQFSPDQVAFGDIPGYGGFDIGHAREHMQFNQVLAAQASPILIPDYDFLTFLTSGPRARYSILESHAQVHILLRAALGFTGVDLSAVDLDNQDDFYSWSGAHATEHAIIRQIMGIH